MRSSTQVDFMKKNNQNTEKLDLQFKSKTKRASTRLN